MGTNPLHILNIGDDLEVSTDRQERYITYAGMPSESSFSLIRVSSIPGDKTILQFFYPSSSKTVTLFDKSYEVYNVGPDFITLKDLEEKASS